VRIIEKMGELKLWVEFNREIENNALVGLTLDAGLKQDRVSYKYIEMDDLPIIGNTDSSVTIDISSMELINSDDGESNVEQKINEFLNQFSGDSEEGSGVEQISDTTSIAPLLLNTGDEINIKGEIIVANRNINCKKTSIDSGHYHDIDVVNGQIQGVIYDFERYNASFVKFYVDDTINFESEIVQRDGGLFKGGIIRFTNKKNITVSYSAYIVSHTLNTITVETGLLESWDFMEYNDYKVSEGWEFRIDTYGYGYTKDILYKDFMIYSVMVNNDIIRNSTSILLDDTSGISSGDKIKLWDNKSVEYNFVKNVIDSTHIEIMYPTSRSFYVRDNAQLSILSNYFSNTHIHMIRRGEVQPLRINDYLEKGYSSAHRHRSLPLITDINVVLNDSDGIIIAGDSSQIYKSFDDGLSWELFVDLNTYNADQTDILTVNSCTMMDNKMIVGVNGGRIFINDIDKGRVVPLGCVT